MAAAHPGQGRRVAAACRARSRGALFRHCGKRAKAQGAGRRQGHAVQKVAPGDVVAHLPSLVACEWRNAAAQALGFAEMRGH